MKLRLAADIADRIAMASRTRDAFDPHSEADALLSAHPEASVTYEQVLEVLIEETAGLRTPNYETA
ncbi:hypothetical protein EMQ25_09510 [Arsenicitalea aurantiaca]|uniref:Uncharacterized protein n=1 Tax=Arsenicitalea aurantiaca TaxID=1783274 RepID=A0A433XAH7_9HYPH|nr:hypothetical protein [Arsenicitalea aurantiaca]RUT31101.1 hypothetical protein EMQ25_09510 [Arsenicitalea aurantiaca]